MIGSREVRPWVALGCASTQVRGRNFGAIYSLLGYLRLNTQYPKTLFVSSGFWQALALFEKCIVSCGVSSSFEDALCESYRLYREHGPRSTEKLRPLHGWFAEILSRRLDPACYRVQDLNSPLGEAQLQGKYLPKRVDIAIFNISNAQNTSSHTERPIVGLSIRFIGSNFKQNANNYFENLLGECANLRRKRIGFAHFLVLPVKLPYKSRTVATIHYELIEEEALWKYFLLYDDDEHPHRPDVLGLALVEIVEEETPCVRLAKTDSFSEEASRYLKELSVEEFIRRVLGLCELKR